MIINISKIRVHITKEEKRTGICSQSFVESDRHCLLCDFDNTGLSDLIDTLLLISLKYNLPAIYIIESSKGNYHAYSFCSRTFREIVHILSDIPQIDMGYLRIGMARGFFTLRISLRKDSEFKLVKVIASVQSNEMSPFDLTINEYLTSNKGRH